MFAKKNVVAAAALTLLAVAAHAEVTAYGNLDVSIGRKQDAFLSVDPLAGTVGFERESRSAVDSNDMSESFIGFKGQEDLGGGLKAVFKLESLLAVDDGATVAGQFWSRNATVGLAGDFGAVNLGRFESLFKLQAAQFNPFGYSATFSPSVRLGLGKGGLPDAVTALGGAAPASLFTGGSWSNGISYESPNLSGFTLAAQVSLKEGAKSTDTTYGGGAYALGANYNAGPLGLSAVLGQVRSTDATDTNVKNNAFLLGASYDFGAVKAYGQYGQDKLKTKGAGDSEKVKFYQIGAAIPVTSAGSVLLSFGDSKYDEDGVNFKTRDLSAGYTHTLSKRTSVYAAWINERQKAGVEGVGSDSETTNSFAVGVRHSF